jgi:hypothetical protein
MRKNSSTRRSHSTIRFRPGGVVPLALGLVAVGGVVLVSVNTVGSRALRAKAAALATSRVMVELTPQQLDVGLHRAGVTPERLAAAGVLHSDISTLVSAGRVYLTLHQIMLDTADTDAGTARATCDRLQRLVDSGLANEADVAALEAANAALTNAMIAQNQILTGLYDAAIDGLGEPQSVALAVMKANGTWDLPIQYLAVNRNEPQWVGLRDDLANLRIAEQLEEEPDPTCLQDVNTANADPAVSAAATNLENGLALVKQAWDVAING